MQKLELSEDIAAEKETKFKNEPSGQVTKISGNKGYSLRYEDGTVLKVNYKPKIYESSRPFNFKINKKYVSIEFV